MKLTRKIDKLGRLVLPSDFRSALDIERAEVTLTLEDDSITVRKKTPTCRLCGSAEELNGDFKICRSCIEKIKRVG